MNQENITRPDFINQLTAAGAVVQTLAQPPNNLGLPGDAMSHSAFGSIKLMRFASHADRQGTERSLEAVLREIQNPPCQIKSLIAEIRSAYLSAGGGGEGKVAIRELKSKLPAATFSATGGRRTVESANGLIVLDLDELRDRLQPLRQAFECDQHVVAVFASPSGDGLKVVFRVPPSKGEQIEMRRQHRRSFKAVEAYVHRKFAVRADPAASDLLRLCYLSYDPSCRINEHALELDVDRHFPSESEDPDNSSDDPLAKEGRDVGGGSPKEGVVEALLRSIPTRPDYSTWLKVSAAVRNSLGSTERAIALLSAWSPEECLGEYALLLESSRFDRIGFGTLVLSCEKAWV